MTPLTVGIIIDYIRDLNLKRFINSNTIGPILLVLTVIWACIYVFNHVQVKITQEKQDTSYREMIGPPGEDGRT